MHGSRYVHVLQLRWLPAMPLSVLIAALDWSAGLALLEAKLLTASLLSKFEFTIPPNQPRVHYSLTCKHGGFRGESVSPVADDHYRSRILLSHQHALEWAVAVACAPQITFDAPILLCMYLNDSTASFLHHSSSCSCEAAVCNRMMHDRGLARRLTSSAW